MSKNQHAVNLGRARWANLSKEERSKHMSIIRRNGIANKRKKKLLEQLEERAIDLASKNPLIVLLLLVSFSALCKPYF